MKRIALARVQREYAQLLASPPDGVSLFPTSDVTAPWRLLLFGPSGSQYEGGCFLCSIKIPDRYPFAGPWFQFQTPIYHPNISFETGDISRTLIEYNWAPTSTIRFGTVYAVIEEVIRIMEKPDEDCRMMNLESEYLRRRDPEKYVETGKQCTKKYAM